MHGTVQLDNHFGTKIVASLPKPYPCVLNDVFEAAVGGNPVAAGNMVRMKNNLGMEVKVFPYTVGRLLVGFYYKGYRYHDKHWLHWCDETAALLVAHNLDNNYC